MSTSKREHQASRSEVSIKIVGRRNGEEKLRFDNSRERRWLILKLLDDDYLGSVMTRQKYEVNSKSVLSQ